MRFICITGFDIIHVFVVDQNHEWFQTLLPAERYQARRILNLHNSLYLSDMTGSGGRETNDALRSLEFCDSNIVSLLSVIKIYVLTKAMNCVSY